MSKKPVITLVTNYDDWEGLYVDGILKHQGNETDLMDVMLLVKDGYERYEEVEAGEWLYDCGRLPDTLAAVKERNALEEQEG